MTHLLRACSAFLAAFAVCAALVGCQKPGNTSSPAASASAAKVLSVGTDAAYAPFEYQDTSGRIVGFDIDLVSAISAKAGVEVKFVNTPWEGIFNALAQGDRDLLVSSITITPERRQTMDFSAPYFDARQLIALKTTSKVSRFEDLKGLKVGVQNGTTGDEAVSRLFGKTHPDVRRFDSTPLALKELEAGGVDAVVADNGVVRHYVAHNSGGSFKTIDDPSFAAEQYGIAFKKGNDALRARFDQGLAAIRADGTYDALYTKYFGAAASAASGAR